MYALFEYKGKQYKAEKGLEILVDKIDTDEEKIVIDSVLLVSNEGNVKVGTPYVSGCQVVAKKDIKKLQVIIKRLQYKCVFYAKSLERLITISAFFLSCSLNLVITLSL